MCKLDVHDGESLTTTGEAVGTIAYMAPEQIRGASKVDERADLYAFAMVVFEALSGRLAYDASGSIALIACKLEKPARSIRDLGAHARPAGARRAARALPRAPPRRPPRVGRRDAARVALARARDRRAVAAVAPGRASHRAADRGGAHGRADAGDARGAARALAHRAPRWRAGRCIASCVVLVTGAAACTRRPPPRSPRPTAAARAAPRSPPAPAAGLGASATPAADLSASQLEMPPVILGGGPDVRDAGPAPRSARRAPGKRIWPRPPARRPPRATTEPQIVNEPRY